MIQHMRPLSPTLLLAVLMTWGCSSGVDHAGFDTLNRAALTVREQVGVGVNLVQYRTLIGSYSTELALAAEKAANQPEHQFVALHGQALRAYRDALTVWEAKIEAGTETLGSGRKDLAAFPDQYALEGTRRSNVFVFDAETAIHKMWGVAAAKLSAADAIYRGEPFD
jgi:hypothetical protein